MIAVPLLATPLLVLLGESDFFLHHGASVWVQANDAVFDLKDRNCKVLIFGDSTAMTGIDPAVVEERTRLPTCNISVTSAVLSVTDRLSLDYYLAHNARPDVLVVQLSPEGFQRHTGWEDTVYPEGMVELLRHGSALQSRALFLHHPQHAFTFAGYVAGFTAWYGIRQAIYYTTGIAFKSDRLVVQNGFFTAPLPARTRCESLDGAHATEQLSAAREIVENYRGSKNGGNVLVDVAPIPACDKDLNRYQQELTGITSNRMQSLPIYYFNDERHFTASGSRVLSHIVADQVISAVGRPEATQPTTLSSLYALRDPSPSGTRAVPSATQ